MSSSIFVLRLRGKSCKLVRSSFFMTGNVLKDLQKGKNIQVKNILGCS